MTEYDKMTKTELIEELRRKEKLFSSAYELEASSDDAIIGKSLDGTISSWNRGAEKIYGYSAQEIIGQNIAILSPPDRHDEVLRILEKIKRGERVEHFETVRVTKEGRQIHVSLSISPIIDTAGEIIGASTIARDITKRKRTEEALRFTQFAIDRTIDQAFWMTEDGHFFYVNDAACRALGYSRDELLQMSVPDIGPTFPPEVFARHWRDLQENGSATFESCHRAKDGHVYPVEIRANYVVFDGREYNCAFATDITERKRMEEELLLTKFCIDKASITICLTAPDGKILDVNDYMCKSLGYTREELTSMIIFDVDPTLTHETWPEHRKKVQVTGTRTFETLHRRKDGTTFSVEVTVNYLTFGGKEVGISFARDITERKRVEEELKESELRYREVFENTSGCIFLLDVTEDGRFKFAGFNPAEEKAVGFSNAEMYGKFIEEALPPELASQVIANYRRCVEAGASIYFDEELDLPVGRRYFHTVLIPVRNVVGDIYRIVGVARDITEARQAERELQRSNDLLRAIIAAAPTAIIGVDLDGKVQTVWNPAAEKMLGWSAQEIMGRALPSVPMEKQEEFRRFRERIRSGKTLDGVEVRRERRDGTPIDYSIYASPLHDAEGRITGNIAVLVDITEHKRMEEELRLAHDELEKRVVERTEQLEKTAEALRTSEERYALAVQGANDAIWDMNLATGEVYHSLRYRSMLGFEDDEMADNVNFNECMERIHPDDHQMVMEARDACLEGRRPVYEVEYRLRHKDGTYRWVASRGACLRDSQGRPYRMAGSLTDITERKKLEQQLLQAQKMESIGILAGGVAHEFNNQLTAISGYGQILQESISPDDELSQDSIGQVLKAAERAAELTRGLLAFSRKQVISPKPVHIDTLISNTSRLIQRMIGEDVEFSIDFSGKNLMIKADPGQIEQVLMNLATNARDAMPHGGRLTITTRQMSIKEGSEAQYDLAGPGKYALISVTDTGTGIDKKSLECIFEPFYTTKEVGMGTGLGLSIIHGIVKQHNGSILVSSELGKGTSFNIYLPLIEGHAVTEKSEMTAPLAAGTETLLVAEDEEIVRNLMKKILEKAGYKVIVADNGEEAVTRFEEHDDISLVLADMVMPRKNGKEMLDEIRKIKPDTKAVFISGYSADIIAKKGKLEEGMEFITKPFKKDDLLQKIREVLDKD